MKTKVPSLRLALLLMTAAACGGGGDGGTGPGPGPQPSPVVLQIVSGNAQAGMAGEELWEPLVVRATRDGQPVQSQLISFSATAGTVNIPTGTTNAEGEARVRWRLPAEESAVAAARVHARLAAGADSVSFSARVPGRADLELVTVDGGLPVKMLVYDAGAFTTGSYIRHDFADSVRLWVRPAVHDEIAAYTPGRAPLLLAPSWSRGGQPVRLQFRTDVIRMPITFWVVQPPFDSAAMLIERNLQGMRDSWEAQAGIGVRDVRIVDATNTPGAARFQGNLGSPICTDPAFAGLYTIIGRDQGRINVYHVGQPPFASAAYCGEGNILFFPLSHQRSNFVLAHELGHGFHGLHHETIPDNIMHFEGRGTGVSAGQMFQAHYSASSLLNTHFNAYPEAMRRPCTPGVAPANPVCPPTDFVLD